MSNPVKKEKYRKDKEFWMKKLEDFPPSPELPVDLSLEKKEKGKTSSGTGNGKKAGNDRHFDTKGKVYPLVGNEKSGFFCIPLPTPYPFGLPADYQPKRQ